MPKTPTPDVRPGQVWADADVRCEGRTIRVDAVEDGKALCIAIREGWLERGPYEPTKGRRLNVTGKGRPLIADTSEEKTDA